MIISRATEEDIPTLAGFQCDMAMETENLELSNEKVVAGVEAMFDDPSLGEYYVAKIDGEVAGCLMTTREWSEWRNGTILWIQSVYVSPNHRRKGVYAGLYEHIKDLVRSSNKLQGIRLYVDKTNVKAQQVYQALGMNNQHYDLYEWIEE